MGSKNVETVRAAHHAFNRRDWNAMVEAMDAEMIFTDEARSSSTKGRLEFVEWASNWVTVFSDARIEEVDYIDAGYTVVARYLATGTNDGPLGPLPATHHRIAMAVCEVWEFDSSGKVIAGAAYYDQLSILMQLGHAQLPPL